MTLCAIWAYSPFGIWRALSKNDGDLSTHFRFWNFIFIPFAALYLFVLGGLSLVDDYQKIGTGKIAAIQFEDKPFVAVMPISEWVDKHHTENDRLLIKAGHAGYGQDKLVTGFGDEIGGEATWLNAYASEGNFDHNSAGKAMFSLLGIILVDSIGYFSLVFGFFPLLAVGGASLLLARFVFR